MLQCPIPVIVIVFAESICAFHQFLVSRPVHGHAHVMLCRSPGFHFNFIRFVSVITNPRVCAEGQYVAVGTVFSLQAPHGFEDVVKVGREVVVLLNEEHQALVILQGLDFVPDEVQLPPPVVLGLAEVRLPVVSEGVGELGVVAAHPQGGGAAHIPRAVSGVVARELPWVELQAEGEEDLQHGAEVDGVHDAVDAGRPQVVAEDEEQTLQAAGPAQ